MAVKVDLLERMVPMGAIGLVVALNLDMKVMGQPHKNLQEPGAAL